jgi:hypothetical protein
MFQFTIHINVTHAGKRKTSLLFLSSKKTFFFFFYRFYCDSSSALDEHNQTHTPNTLSKSTPIEEISIPLPTPTNNTNSEKPTPSNKVKVHRCRQCSYVSSIKV